MQFSVDLGFRSLVLAILLVVLSVVLKVKWQRYVARKLEIKRLLVLVSEETARAEQETTLSYYSSFDTLVSSARPTSLPSLSTSSSPAPRSGYQCAVCFEPTTTRCSCCKSVRYCSGKCQIIHWRQGHKENCRPFKLSHHVDGNGSLHQDVANAIHKETFSENHDDDSFDSTRIQSKLAHPKISPIISQSGCVDAIDGEVTDETTRYSASESSGDSFSGFSSSPHSVRSSALKKAELVDPCCSTDSVQEELDVNSKEEESYSNQVSRRNDCEDSCQTKGYLSPGKGSFVKNGCGRNVPLFSSETSSCENTIYKKNISCSSATDVTVSESGNEFHDTFYQFSTPDQEDGDVDKVSNTKIDESSTLVRNFEVDEIRLPRKPLLSSYGSGKCSTSCVSRAINQYSDIASASDANLQPRIQVGQCSMFDSEISSSSSTKIAISGLKGNATPTQLSSSWKEKTMFDMNPERQEKFESDTANSTTATSRSPGSELKSSIAKVREQIQEFPKSGRYNYMGNFSYDLFVKLYNSNKLELQPFGLVNCGNSCYANAVLQCLAFTPPLTAFFAQGLHSKTCVSSSNEWCFACEFERLILKAKGGESLLSPISIVSHLQRIGIHLSRGCEEDAHEFLRCAIDTMQSICRKEGDANIMSSLRGETSLVDLTFGGYLHSKIRCLKCNSKSERQERMLDLAVEIEGDVQKLEDAIRRFTRSEILDAENKYYCSRCKTKERAKKKLTILEAPNVLTIALKRFQAGKFGKLIKSVDFPEVLDLAPYMSGTCDKSPIYKLFAVIVHLDVKKSAFSGHYVCYVKNSENKWFKVDDSVVTPVDLGRVLTKEAYMFFYSRYSPRAPRLLGTGLIASSESNGNPPINNLSRSTSSSPLGCSQENVSSYESFYLKFHRLQKIIEEDSSSDSLSFSSSNSDEGSSSTDSTKDSLCTDEHADHILGSASTFDSESSSSSSSSPLYSRHPYGYSRGSSGQASSSIDPESFRTGMSEEKSPGSVGSGRTDAATFLYSDSIRLTSNSVGKSSSRKAETYGDVRHSSPTKRSASHGPV